MNLSVMLYCFTAARIPTGIAMTIVSSSDAPVSSNVLGMRWNTLSRTGVPSVIE